MKTAIQKFILFIAIFHFSFSAMAEFGGISGGGGGTSNPGSVSMSDIDTAVKESKLLIESWLNAEEYNYKALKSSSGEAIDEFELLLFNQGVDVYDILINLKIDIQHASPCFDANGREVDGSIYSNTPGNICISAKTLSGKLNKNNYEYETVALVMHEIAHLLGADEQLATQIQNFIMKDIKTTTYFDEHYRISMHLLFQTSEIRKGLFAIKSGEFTRQCYEANSLATLYFDLLSMTSNHTYQLSVLRANYQDGLFAYYVKTLALRDYACSIDERLKEVERKAYKNTYEKGFSGNRSVTNSEYLKNIDPSSTYRKGLVSADLIYIQSNADFRNEVEDTMKFLDEIEWKIANLVEARFPINIYK